MLIGLTGGIGSGKSTVARRWVELGATEIDADLLAREVVRPGTQGLIRLVAEFGSDILEPAGGLDRAKLGKMIFSDNQSRIKVEAILHPLIQDLAAQRVAEADGVIVYTIPLLVETNSKLRFEKVVAISCSLETRVQRLIRTRGLTAQEARDRIMAQATDLERESVADWVIDSDCPMNELIFRADKAYQLLTT